MFMPLLVIPFITLLFWVLGAGRGTPAEAKQMLQPKLNLELPKAYFDQNENELWDKFKLYEQAERDSLKQSKARKDDPYYRTTLSRKKQPSTRENPTERPALITSPSWNDDALKNSEAEIHKKLQKLTQRLDQPIEAKLPREYGMPTGLRVDPSTQDKEIARLEKMMMLMGGDQLNDPEMEKIDKMLDKILAIQHPGQLEDKLDPRRNQDAMPTLPVAPAVTGNSISLVAPPRKMASDSSSHEIPVYTVNQEKNTFYGLEEDGFENPLIGNALEAVVHHTQTVVSGATVKMRLLHDVQIANQRLEEGSFVYGECNLNGDRLTISVRSIRNDNNILPVSLSVYDLDGMAGIHVPGALTRDAAKQASDQAIQGMPLYSMDPSLEMQAATAGIETAKGLFRKKVKQVKITLKAGYRILLQDGSFS